jgi:hypothetical protein
MLLTLANISDFPMHVFAGVSHETSVYGLDGILVWANEKILGSTLLACHQTIQSSHEQFSYENRVTCLGVYVGICTTIKTCKENATDLAWERWQHWKHICVLVGLPILWLNPIVFPPYNKFDTHVYEAAFKLHRNDEQFDQLPIFSTRRCNSLICQTLSYHW